MGYADGRPRAAATAPRPCVALAFGPGLPDQTLVEVFYRLQLTETLAVTPDLQYVVDPALDPEQDSNWLVGIRARLAI